MQHSTWYPHLTVATIIEHNAHFLMVEENSKDSQNPVYNQPAGHVEAGETLIQAAIRETLEETGYLVEVTDLLGIYSYTPPAFPNKTYYRVCFVAQVIEQTNQKLDNDIIQTHWLSAEQIIQSSMARSPLVIQCIQDYQNQQRFPLSLINENFLKPQPLFTES